MIIQFFLLFLILFLLFLLSRKITANLYVLVYLLIRSKRLALGILSLVLLPGTTIHEISHFLLATLVRVKTGKLTIIPEIGEKGEVRAGKLEIEKADPFRHALIGLAPIFIGLLIIYYIGVFFFSNIQLITHNPQPITILGIYLLFATSTTMFSSKKDIESLVIVLPIIFLIFAVLYYLGLRIFLEENSILFLSRILQQLNKYLLFSAVFNFAVYLLIVSLINLLEKLLRRKVVRPSGGTSR